MPSSWFCLEGDAELSYQEFLFYQKKLAQAGKEEFGEKCPPFAKILSNITFEQIGSVSPVCKNKIFNMPSN